MGCARCRLALATSFVFTFGAESTVCLRWDGVILVPTSIVVSSVCEWAQKEITAYSQVSKKKRTCTSETETSGFHQALPPSVHDAKPLQSFSTVALAVRTSVWAAL